MKSLKQKAWVRWTFSSRSPSPPFWVAIFFPSPPCCSFLSSSPGSSPSNSTDLEVKEDLQLMPDHWNNCICEAASTSLEEIWQRIVNLDKFTNWKPSASSFVKHFVVNKPATSEKISFHEIKENHQIFKHLCKICNLRKILGLKRVLRTSLVCCRSNLDRQPFTFTFTQFRNHYLTVEGRQRTQRT